jgi:hypothetical protein
MVDPNKRYDKHLLLCHLKCYYLTDEFVDITIMQEKGQETYPVGLRIYPVSYVIVHVFHQLLGS